MRFFDSHCHIEDERAFGKDRDAMLRRAREAGVLCMMIAGISLERSRRAVALSEENPGLFASVGIHPHDSESCNGSIISILASLARNPRVRAWGECGLDFNRMHAPMDVQERWLEAQIDAAMALKLPIIFHERDSGGKLLSMLRHMAPSGLSGVVHCFSGNLEEMKGYLDLGLHIGITGILTHKQRGEELRRMVRMLPDDGILIETDAPYLTPSPERNRHKRNEPAFVPSVLKTLAAIRKTPEEELAETVFQNTCELFRVKPDEIPDSKE
ncbi:TatD DNase family protein [Desulfobotulus alkaliphilus]|uniref:TatD DNase family protein n=2 Tax=Desulfobotulus alkaliphilus TaxID=622671 RepID=A0A562S673_9BACT|nr:TatD family hydrolase [Desulfobotulus alkaliphilus]TWI76835.1 TatD DNase family protein [Desulfobotulus alkaliphilus]